MGKHAPASSKSFLISLGTAIAGALVALGIVVGIAVVALNAGNDDGVGALPTNTPTRSTPITSPTPTESIPATPTQSESVPPAAKAPSETTLRVLNGAGRSGLAASFADRAKAEGYPQPVLGNADAATKSTIYYRADSEAEAEALRARFPELTEIAPAPASFKTDVMLTVVLGADYPSTASPSSSPS